MVDMEKGAASKAVGSHMKTRTGTRPYRASTLLGKTTATMPAPWSETPPEDSKAPEDFNANMAEAVGGEEFGQEKEGSARWRELMRLGELGSDDVVKLRRAKLLDYAREIAGLEKGTKAMSREMGVKMREYPSLDIDKIGPDGLKFLRSLGPKKSRQFATAQNIGAGVADPVTAEAHFWPGLMPLGKDDSARAHKGALRAILRRHEIDELRSMRRLGALKQPVEVVEARLPEQFYTHTHPEVIARQQGNLAMMHPKVQQAKMISTFPGDEAEAARTVGAILGREGDVLKGGVTPKEMSTLRKLYDPVVRGEVSEMRALTRHFSKSAAEFGQEKEASDVEIGPITSDQEARKFLDRFSKLQKDVYTKGEIVAAKKNGEYVGGVILRPGAGGKYQRDLYRKHGVKPSVSISNFIVSPSERGKGVGGKLLSAAVAGRGTVVLGTDNRGEHTDASALHLYEQAGFKPVKRERRSTFWAKTAAEFAPGIPAKLVRLIPAVKAKAENQEWDASMSLHPARRRGDHIDLRLVDPQGRAHSWALPKDLPDPGKSTYAVQQPTHTGEYALQTKPFELPKGYGETRPGEMVQPISVGKVEVVESGEKKIRFLRHLGRNTEEFVLRRIQTPTGDGKKLWAFHNATKNRDTAEGKRLPDYKPKYQEVAPENIDVNDGTKVLTAKIDGAHGLMQLHGNDAYARLYSYRQPVSGITGVIEHTHKMPDFHTRMSPDSLKGTLVRTEMWFSDEDGKALPSQKIGGLLNASALKSRRMQEEMGALPRITVVDVVRSGGRNMEDAPYAEKLKVMERVAKDVPGVEMPPMAWSPEEKSRMLADIKSGRLKETKEGVVEHDLLQRGAAFVKAVFKPVQDVFVRGIFKKPAGEARGHAGGIEYSYTPEGPIMGRVGTGFDHRTRKDMLQNPESYVGRVAKVQSTQAYENRADPSQLGALRAPSFQGWHLDKNDPALMKEAQELPEWLSSQQVREDSIERALRRLRESTQKSPQELVVGVVRSRPTGRAVLQVADTLEHLAMPKVSSAAAKIGGPVAAGLLAAGVGGSVIHSRHQQKKMQKRREFLRAMREVQRGAYRDASLVAGAVDATIRQQRASGKSGPLRVEAVLPKEAAKLPYGPGGKWIHDRAHGMMKEMKERYGDEKGKQIAYATATQQAHAVRKSPKGFRTPEGVREARIKHDAVKKPPKDLKKTASIWPEPMSRAGAEAVAMIARVARTPINGQ